MKKSKNNFLKEFLKDSKTVGSVRPSSPALTKTMLNHINFNSAKIIVEFGPGTGVFTRKVIENLKSDTAFFVFELHKPFFDLLQEEFSEFSNVHLINDSALNIGKYITETEDSVDVIISSLPLSNIDNHIANQILLISKQIIKPEGKFLQYQYSLNYRKRLKRIFKEVTTEFTLNNLPPAFVYSCTK
ncbi:MAG: methyltransferase [Brumimicrobium sp.]|nr:methyltransferase [Brumimicrobium sp.]MCO5268854.1 methyltransferase [Brumimicrobium sp.]